jgi:hypothetical protein
MGVSKKTPVKTKLGNGGSSIMAPARKFPKKSVGKPATLRVKAKVHKPKVTAGPMSGPKQKPVATPMKKKHRVARTTKAKTMSKRGAKGPVQYKGFTKGMGKY